MKLKIVNESLVLPGRCRSVICERWKWGRSHLLMTMVVNKLLFTDRHVCDGEAPCSNV